MDLYYHFDKLDLLKKDYENKRSVDEPYQAFRDKMVNIIGLTQKFKSEPLAPITTILHPMEETKLFLKKFWLLFIGIPFFLWAIYSVATVNRLKDEHQNAFFLLIIFILGLSILVLFLIVISNRRDGKNKKENQIAKKN